MPLTESKVPPAESKVPLAVVKVPPAGAKVPPVGAKVPLRNQLYYPKLKDDHDQVVYEGLYRISAVLAR